MELEEAIRILKLWNKAEEMTINDNDIEDKTIYQQRKKAIERLLKYIKEESISRAVVEEHKKEIEKRYYSILGKNSVEACVLKCKLEGIEEILTKGENKE